MNFKTYFMRKKILFNRVKCFRLSILLIVFSGLCTSSSLSQPNTWLGGPLPQDTLASNPLFWSAGLPTATSDIIIPNGAKPLFVDINTTYASVTFEGGNQLTRVGVGPVIVTVTGNITIENASAPRGIIILGSLDCTNIVGGTNTDPLGLGNVIFIADNGELTVPGNVTGCNLGMLGTPIATFGGNFTGGQVYAPFNLVTSTIEFNSADPQTIPPGIYGTIIFSGGGNKTLSGPVTVTSNALFVSGSSLIPLLHYYFLMVHSADCRQ